MFQKIRQRLVRFFDQVHPDPRSVVISGHAERVKTTIKQGRSTSPHSAHATDRLLDEVETQISLGNSAGVASCSPSVFAAADSACADSRAGADCTQRLGTTRDSGAQVCESISSIAPGGLNQQHSELREYAKELGVARPSTTATTPSFSSAPIGGRPTETRDEIARLYEHLAELQRLADGRYAALEKLRDERDRWNSLYHESVMGSAAANGILTRNVAKAMDFASNVLIELNKERGKSGLPAYKLPEVPRSETPWTALCEQYVRRHIALFEEARAKFGQKYVEPPYSFRPFQCNGKGADGEPCREEVVLCLKHHDELSKLEADTKAEEARTRSELTRINSELDNRYSARMGLPEDEDLDAEIARLEELAATITRARGNASIATVEDKLETAVARAQKILRAK